MENLFAQKVKNIVQMYAAGEPDTGFVQIIHDEVKTYLFAVQLSKELHVQITHEDILQCESLQDVIHEIEKRLA
jgi:hypothetical protein